MQRSFMSTIRGKLLSRTMALVLIPVLVLGGLAVFSLRSLDNTTSSSVSDARESIGEDLVGTRTSEVADQISRELALFLGERLDDARAWALDPGFITSAINGYQQAEADGLPELTGYEIETRFANLPQLGDPDAENRLTTLVANTPAFKEVFFTDAHGYNVAYTNQTSDFIQSDEGWWQGAWENGVDVSAPDFDASAGVFAIDLSVRIDNAGERVGVLKAVLDIQIVKDIADRFAAGDDQFAVTVVNGVGQILAETSTGHAESRILGDVDLGADGSPAVQYALQGDASAVPYLITDEVVGGYGNVNQYVSALGSDNADASDPFDWTIVVEQPAEVAFAALAPFEDLQNEVDSTTSTLLVILIAVAAAAIVAAVVMSILFSRRLTGPINALRDAASEATDVSLPQYVEAVDEMDPDDELPELAPIALETGDEVEDLAHSFNSMQQTAASLAAEQAQLRRRNVAATFVNLGRRNQSLLSRQLEHINTMEKSETDPETLARLFQLDHLATRMRRNAESLLVLAGEETPRQFRRPVSIYQLVQAAGAEIEDFDRLNFVGLDDAHVEGGAATDVAHLVAELLENASKFSPPGTEIQVHGRLRDSGYNLALIDQGIGMEEDELETANARLGNPAEFDRAPSAYLGLFVAAHLARRHGLKVKLSESPYGGITAQVNLPPSVLVVPEEDRDSNGDTGDALPRRAARTQPQPDPQPQGVFDVPAATSDVEATPTTPIAEPVLEPVTEPVAAEPVAEPQPVEVREPAGEPPPLEVRRPAATVAAAPTQPTDPVDDRQSIEALADSVAAEAAAETPPPMQLTASGFRRRRRGHEGAPTQKSPVVPEPPRRDPREVQASLLRFRSGVETGRSQPANGHAPQPINGGNES